MTFMESNLIAQELLTLAQSLSVAVDHDFMAREHAASVWKRVLKCTAYDVPLVAKKEEKKDVVVKKD